MFFNAHAYYSIQKGHGSANPLRIVGSLLPDCALTGAINWDDLHNTDTIRAFSKTLPENASQLGQGLEDHYELDTRSHDAYKNGGGYAFSHQTTRLRELVAQACGISTERARGLAHNFIESGVDINLLRHDNTIQGKVHRALDVVDMDLMAEYMASFFKIDAAQTQRRLAAFKDVITKHDLQDVEGWVGVWNEINLLLLGNSTNQQATKKALLLAVELTGKDYAHVLAA